MTIGFIKNPTLIEEKISNEDYLDIALSIKTLSEKLSSVDSNAMIGIVGAFGIGKSTLISQVKSSRDVTNEEWLHFDAWQFPKRKELWDGLVLETARHLSKLEVIKRKIDGQSGRDKKLATDVAGSAVKVTAAIYTGGLSSLLEPIFGLVKNLEYFAEKSPATRVFEIQDIFSTLINSIDKEKIIFILEDVDRSGEDGLFFLETFRQFILKAKLDKKVVVITPISNISYEQNLDTYLKCFDYVEFFNKKAGKNLSKFVASVFDETETYDTEALTDFISYIYNKYPDMTLRKIKLILRQANLNYMELQRLGYKPNSLICIGVQASKYILMAQQNISYFSHFTSNRSVSANNEINRLFVITQKAFRAYSNEHFLTEKGELGNTFLLNFVTRSSPTDERYPSIPYQTDRIFSEDGQSRCCLVDFYFFDL